MMCYSTIIISYANTMFSPHISYFFSHVNNSDTISKKYSTYKCVTEKNIKALNLDFNILKQYISGRKRYHMNNADEKDDSQK